MGTGFWFRKPNWFCSLYLKVLCADKCVDMVDLMDIYGSHARFQRYKPRSKGENSVLQQTALNVTFQRLGRPLQQFHFPVPTGHHDSLPVNVSPGTK